MKLSLKRWRSYKVQQLGRRSLLEFWLCFEVLRRDNRLKLSLDKGVTGSSAARPNFWGRNILTLIEQQYFVCGTASPITKRQNMLQIREECPPWPLSGCAYAG